MSFPTYSNENMPKIGETINVRLLDFIRECINRDSLAKFYKGDFLLDFESIIETGKGCIIVKPSDCGTYYANCTAKELPTYYGDSVWYIRQSLDWRNKTFPVFEVLVMESTGFEQSILEARAKVTLFEGKIDQDSTLTLSIEQSNKEGEN